MKDASNSVKGNFLRERSLRLIAAIELRFTDHFQAFCTTVISQILTFDAHGNLQRQIEKDALMHIVKMRLNDQDGIDVNGLLSVLDAELQPVNLGSSNLIVMKRAVELLTKLSDFEEMQNNP